MEIETQELTTCEVAPDGCAISLGFVDSKGEPATIRLSVNQVGALVMTLPGLISKALQTRFGDRSLRYAYPLDSWVIERYSTGMESSSSMVMVRCPTCGLRVTRRMSPSPSVSTSYPGSTLDSSFTGSDRIGESQIFQRELSSDPSRHRA